MEGLEYDKIADRQADKVLDWEQRRERIPGIV
jgi:hypothetical protein